MTNPSTWTPMFPLGLVLFPGVGLPLRIFEPRYRQMLRDCLDGGPNFAIALIAAGNEVGGGDERFDVATTTRIVHADVAADGSAMIVVVGAERVRVAEWLTDAPYPRAVVEPFIDVEDFVDVDRSALDGAERRVRRLLALRAEFNLPAAPATTEVSDDPEMALWQLCALLPTGPHDDLALLSTPHARARLALLHQLLDGFEPADPRR